MPCAARPRDRENGPCSARPRVQPDNKAHVQQVNTFTIADWCGGAPAAACIMLWCNMNFDFQGIPRIYFAYHITFVQKSRDLLCSSILHQFLRNLHTIILQDPTLDESSFPLGNHRSAHQLLGFSRSHTTHKKSEIETQSEIFPFSSKKKNEVDRYEPRRNSSMVSK